MAMLPSEDILNFRVSPEGPYAVFPEDIRKAAQLFQYMMSAGYQNGLPGITLEQTIEYCAFWNRLYDFMMMMGCFGPQPVADDSPSR